MLKLLVHTELKISFVICSAHTIFYYTVTLSYKKEVIYAFFKNSLVVKKVWPKNRLCEKSQAAQIHLNCGYLNF